MIFSNMLEKPSFTFKVNLTIGTGKHSAADIKLKEEMMGERLITTIYRCKKKLKNLKKRWRWLC